MDNLVGWIIVILALLSIVVALLCVIIFGLAELVRFWHRYIRVWQYHSAAYDLLLACGLGLLILFWLVFLLLPMGRNWKDNDLTSLYNVVNVIFLPLQTFLLVLAGTIAYRTYFKAAEFKQRDIESDCVKRYDEIEAFKHSDEFQILSYMRRYWSHQIHQYYMWSRRLISDQLYMTWLEGRRIDFRRNETYLLRAAEDHGIIDYKTGFEYLVSQGHFRGNEKFVVLVRAIEALADGDTPLFGARELPRYR
jgi:hypothetical protein